MIIHLFLPEDGAGAAALGKASFSSKVKGDEVGDAQGDTFILDFCFSLLGLVPAKPSYTLHLSTSLQNPSPLCS